MIKPSAAAHMLSLIPLLHQYAEREQRRGWLRERNLTANGSVGWQGGKISPSAAADSNAGFDFQPDWKMTAN